MTAGSNSHTSNNLDLMRLGFASMVLLSHAAELIYGNRSHEPLTEIFHTISLGEFGVDCFFIISGFVIAQSWERDPRWLLFLRNRILRIYPGFLVAFILSTAIVGLVGTAAPTIYIRELKPLLLLREAILLNNPSTPATFQGSHYADVNGSLWTIKYEFFCYILVVGLGLAGLLRRSGATTLLWLIIVAASLMFRLYHGETGAIIAGGTALTLLRLVPMFGAGIVIFKTKLWQVRKPFLIVSALTLLIIGLEFPITAELSLETVGAYLLFIIGFTPIWHAKAREVPDVSYGVYLYGWPIEKLLILFLPSVPFLGIFVLSWFCSITVGYVSWLVVEKPALSLKRKSYWLRRPSGNRRAA